MSLILSKRPLHCVVFMVCDTPVNKLKSGVLADSALLMACSPWPSCDSVSAKPGQLFRECTLIKFADDTKLSAVGDEV